MRRHPESCTCEEDYDPQCPLHLRCDCATFHGRRELCVKHGHRWMVLIDGRPETRGQTWEEARRYAGAAYRIQDMADVRMVCTG